MADFDIRVLGESWLLTPNNRAARNWCQSNLAADLRQDEDGYVVDQEQVLMVMEEFMGRKENDMLSQPAASNSNDDSPQEPMQTVRSRQKDDSSSGDGSIEPENEALRSFREKLKRSPHRPQWWSNHVRSLFR